MATEPVMSLQPTQAPTSTSSIVSPPAAVGSGDVHATAGTILEGEGSNYVAWSPDGKWLVVSGNQAAYIYDTLSMTQVRNVPVKYGAKGLAISPDSHVLAVIDIVNAVRLFDPATGGELQTLPRTNINTSASGNSFLAFTPDSRTLAIIIGDTVKLFDVAGGNETGTLPIKGANAIAISPDGKSLFVAGWTGPITVWDLATGTQTRTFCDIDRGGVNRIALSRDGSLLASAGGASTDPIILWEVASGRQVRSFSGHTDSVTDLAFSPDGKLLASASNDVTIKLWNVATGNLVQTLLGQPQPATSLAFSPDGAILASITNDPGVWLWGLSSK
jgi:WD40 repeat protein